MMDEKKVGKIIHDNRTYLGFGDWQVLFEMNVSGMQDEYASVDVTDTEKQLQFKFSEELDAMPTEFFEETIIHELVHARVCLMRMKLEKQTNAILEDLEEDLINDLVRWKTR